MRFTFRWAVLLVSLALIVPAFAADEKKDEKKDDKPAPKDAKPESKEKDKEKEKLVSAGNMVGRMTKLEDAGKYFSLQVTVKQPYVNGRQISYRDRNIDIPMQFAEEVKVRIPNPPPAFDDKGKPKRYTSKELKELKGEGNLPGYPADMSNLKNGQYVQVYLAKVKTAPRTKPAAKKDKEKDKDDDALTENRPLVSMVVIIGEPPK